MDPEANRGPAGCDGANRIGEKSHGGGVDNLGNDRGGLTDGGDHQISLGVFTEDELQDLGIYCGVNVEQVACDVYTQGNNIAMSAASVNFAGNPLIGNTIARAACKSIYQGCISEGEFYENMFIYKSSFTGVGTIWNRYVTNLRTTETSPLFMANWGITEYRGELVARETFPLRTGNLGYASVYLKPSAEGGSIVWRSVGVEYGPSTNLGIGAYLPEPLIVFTTSQSDSGLSNFFYTEGTFGLGGTVLGTISISGYIEP
jgi:hypothetical protein